MFRNLCLFAHFDQDNILADYVPYYLEAIRATGFDIVVISTSDLPADDILRLRSIAHDVILRENKGHDFASWALGIERYASLVSGQLMIANDSVYGPIGDLSRAIERLTSVSSDVYGMIESREINRHLQSWFIIFEPHVHASSAFRSVFRQPFHQMSKADIIRKGEVGLSQSLIANGYNIRALFDGNFNNGQRLRISSNTSHFLWRELIENEDIPFLKIELLRVNPCRIGSISRWIDVVAAKRPELVPMIKDHLVRTSRAAPDHDGSGHTSRPLFCRALFRRTGIHFGGERAKGRKDDVASLHRGSDFHRDLQNFAGRDYAYATAGRTVSGRLNQIFYQAYLMTSGITRRAYYKSLQFRDLLLHLKRYFLRRSGGPH